MSNSKIEEKADALHNKYNGRGIDNDIDDIQEKIATHKNKFNVGVNQAASIVENSLIEQCDTDLSHLATGSKCKERLLDGFTETDMWGDITVVVESTWEPTDDNLQSVGIITDPTGRKKFTLWKQANKQDLEEGKKYHITDVISKNFNDNIEIKITKESSIREHEGFEKSEYGVERFEGQIVKIGSKSGVVKKCNREASCRRFIDPETHECPEHGEVIDNATKEIQLILTVDDGDKSSRFFFNQSQTLNILEKEKQEVFKMGRPSSLDMLNKILGGEYIHITARANSSNSAAAVTNFRLDPEVDRGRINSLLIKARELRQRFN
jgi:hypothetical protein